MLYRCQSCVIDLSRVVAVGEIISSRVFHVTMTGASQIYFEAADRSGVGLDSLRDDRRSLLAAWEQYRHDLPKGKGSITYLEGQYINIVAISAITDVRRVPQDMVYSGGTTSYKFQFDVHMMGFASPIVCKCSEEDSVGVASLRKSHDELVDAWQTLHKREAA